MSSDAELVAGQSRLSLKLPGKNASVISVAHFFPSYAVLVKALTEDLSRVLHVLERASSAPISTRDLRLLHGALRLAEPALRADLSMLSGQLLARLSSSPVGAELRTVLDGALAAGRAQGALLPCAGALSPPPLPEPIFSCSARHARRTRPSSSASASLPMNASGGTNSASSSASSSPAGSHLLAECLDLVWSNDGRHLAVAGQGYLGVWSLRKGELTERTLLMGHRGDVTCVAFTTDGKRVLSGGEDGRVLLHAAKSGRLLSETVAHQEAVTDVGVAPGGKLAFSCSEDGYAAVWALESMQAKYRVHDGRVPVLCAMVDAEGRFLVTGHRDGLVRLWDLPTGAPRHALRGHCGAVLSLCQTLDGLLLSGSADTTVRLWDVDRAVDVDMLGALPGGVSCISVSPDGRTLLAGTWGGALALWDLLGRSRISHTFGKPVNAVAFNPDGRDFAAATRDAQVRLWRCYAHKQRQPGACGGACAALRSGDAFTDAGNGRIASVPAPPTHLAPKTPALPPPKSAPAPLNAHSDLLTCLLLTPAMKPTALVSASFDGSIRAFALPVSASPTSSASALPSAASLALVPLLTIPRAHDGHEVLSLSASLSGSLLASCGLDRSVRLWPSPCPNPNPNPSPHSNSNANANAGVVHANGNVGSKGKAVGSAHPLFTLRAHEADVLCVGVSMDGRLVASGDRGGTLILWDAVRGAVIAQMAGAHRGEIYAVCFAPHAPVLYSAGEDHCVRIWSLRKSGKGEGAFVAHGSAVTALAVTTSGKYVVTAGVDRYVHVRRTEDETRKVLASFLAQEPVVSLAVLEYPLRVMFMQGDQVVMLESNLV